MIIKLFGYTLEIYFYKLGYNRTYAQKLLDRYLLNHQSNSYGPKIGLIKAIRLQEEISLADAKEAVEKMFIFPDGKTVKVK